MTPPFFQSGSHSPHGSSSSLAPDDSISQQGFQTALSSTNTIQLARITVQGVEGNVEDSNYTSSQGTHTSRSESTLPQTVTSNPPETTINQIQSIREVAQIFSLPRKVRKSWVWNTRNAEEYLEDRKWRWRCKRCKYRILRINNSVKVSVS